MCWVISNMTVCYWKAWFTRTGRLADAKDSGFLRAPGTAAHSCPGMGCLKIGHFVVGLGAPAQTQGVAGLVAACELSVCQGTWVPETLQDRKQALQGFGFGVRCHFTVFLKRTCYQAVAILYFHFYLKFQIFYFLLQNLWQ